MDSKSVHTFERIFKNLNAAGNDVLEIGSGHGLTCILFAMMGARNAYGIELMKDAVASSERVRDEMDSKLPAFFTCGDAGKRLPYADSSLDIILVIEVISHVIVSSLDAFVKECLRVLRPGGILYISDGNNAASPMLRRKNHETWDRFENGPPT